MKNFWVALFICTSCFSQGFAGDNVGLLVGKILTVQELDPALKTYGYDNFYKDENLKEKYLIGPTNFNTPYDSLVNKKFKVSELKPIEGSYKKVYSMKIVNDKIGILYYKYQPDNGYFFVFDIDGGLSYPDGYWCKDIVSKKDKFSGIITRNSPLLEPISFSKEKGLIYLDIEIEGSTLNTNKKGVIVLLSDGSKINKPNASVDVRYSEGYKYSAFILLNKLEIARIIKSPITDVKLYIYDAEISNGTKYSEYLKCLNKI